MRIGTLQRSQRPERTRHRQRRSPCGVVEFRVPPFWDFARVAPFNVAEHEVDEAHGWRVAGEAKAFPSNRNFTSVFQCATRQERVHRQQTPRWRAEMADLNGENMTAR